jgi:hypothetical protein
MKDLGYDRSGPSNLLEFCWFLSMWPEYLPFGTYNLNQASDNVTEISTLRLIFHD